jgi:kanamycin kinase
MLKPIKVDKDAYPVELRPLLSGAGLYDSSCSGEASVIFIDRDEGFFLKSAPRGALGREAAMARYFYGKGLSADVLAYISDGCDWLLTRKVPGDDCGAGKYLRQPERLCDTLAERLALLHGLDCSGCPVMDHTGPYLAKAAHNRLLGVFDKDLFPRDWGHAGAEGAWRVVAERGRLLRTDTLLHGDYCLPNVILDDWRFSGFVDLGCGGVGDRHVDVFWAVWTLFFNLKTDKYRERFIDAYGRDKVDGGMLRVVAAVEMFG